MWLVISRNSTPWNTQARHATANAHPSIFLRRAPVREDCRAGDAGLFFVLSRFIRIRFVDDGPCRIGTMFVADIVEETVGLFKQGREPPARPSAPASATTGRQGKTGLRQLSRDHHFSRLREGSRFQAQEIHPARSGSIVFIPAVPHDLVALSGFRSARQHANEPSRDIVHGERHVRRLSQSERDPRRRTERIGCVLLEVARGGYGVPPMPVTSSGDNTANLPSFPWVSNAETL